MKMDFEEYRNASKRPREELRQIRKSYDKQQYDGSTQPTGET